MVLRLCESCCVQLGAQRHSVRGARFWVCGACYSAAQEAMNEERKRSANC